MQVMELYIIEEVGVVDIQQAIYLHIIVPSGFSISISSEPSAVKIHF